MAEGRPSPGGAPWTATPLPARPGIVGPRIRVVLSLVLAGAVAAWWQELSPADLWPEGSGRRLLRDFASAALRPALDYERPIEGAPPFLLGVVQATWRTIVFAVAAMSLAVPAGLLLGYLSSTVRWDLDGRARRSASKGGRRVQWAARVVIAAMRSVHELLWAVIFLAAMGLNTAAAVVAIAIPYGGTLAKVFSEMLDEAPRSAALALRGSGASRVRALWFGLVPRAMPDMAAYAFYRFECALRSSAILGFFGYETLGYHLVNSFSNLQFRESWTYLYAMVGLVLVMELWSGRLRERFVA